MKQADVINSVANKMLTVETKVIDGKEVKVQYQFSFRNILSLIEREYEYRGKTFAGDPTRMIEKIAKIVDANRINP